MLRYQVNKNKKMFILRETKTINIIGFKTKYDYECCAC